MATVGGRELSTYRRHTDECLRYAHDEPITSSLAIDLPCDCFDDETEEEYTYPKRDGVPREQD
jgi:hypothetical protein